MLIFWQLKIISNRFRLTYLDNIYVTSKRGDIRMALEIIKNIVDAERGAEELKTAALQQAEQIRAEAVSKKEEIEIETKKAAKLRQQELIQEAIEASQEEVSKILKDAQSACNDVQKAADAKRDAAVKAVIGKVVGNNGYRWYA